MKMKYILTISLIFTSIILISFAQEDTPSEMSEYAVARFGKGSGINTILFSPDGKHLAVATDIGVWMYDVSNGKGELLHTNETDNITAIAFSSDGKKLVCGDRKNQAIQFWDLTAENNRPYLTLYDRFVQVVDLVFSKDEKNLFSLSPHGYLTKWDLETNKEISAIQFSGNQSIAALGNDGKIFVHRDLNDDSNFRIWDVNDEIFSGTFEDDYIPKTINGFQEDTDTQVGIVELGISPDNNYIVSAHADNIIRVWDTDTKTLRYRLIGHTASINTVAFSPDNKILATGSDDKKIRLWDLENGTLSKTLTGHTSDIKTIDFSPTDLDLLASGSSDGTIRFWDTQTGEELQIFAKGYIDSIYDLAFSKDNKVLSSVTRQGALQLLDINTEKTLPTPNLESLDIRSALSLSHDATFLAYIGAVTNNISNGQKMDLGNNQRKGINLWVLPLGEHFNTIPQWTLVFAFSPDNSMIAVSDPFSGVKILDIVTLTELFSNNREFSHPTGVKFSPNGKLLVIDAVFSDTEIWDIATQRNISPLNIQEVNVVSFSPDSSMLALKQSDHVDIFQITSTGLENHKRFTPNGSLGLSHILVFSPDGKMLLDVIGTGKGANIQIWDLESGNLSGTLIGHLKAISKLLFSHDSKMLASGSLDGTILLWDWERILKNIRKTKEIKK